MVVAKRIESHRTASDLMANAKYLEALSCLKESLVNYGPHISIHLDIASCYYMVKDYNRFQKYAMKALAEFQDIKMVLCADSYIRSCLTLGRLLEELGHFTEALDLYQEASQMEVENRNLLFAIDAQKLRLKVFLGIQHQLSQDYLICEKALLSGLANFDLTHALMMADHFLGATTSASVRFQQLKDLGSVADKRLVTFDHISEILSLSRLTLPELALSLQGHLGSLNYFECDPFEQAMWDLLKGDFDLMRTSEMSLHGALKYLSLILKHSQDSELRRGAVAKSNLLLQGLPKKSRDLAIKRWSLAQTNNVITVRETETKCILSYFDRSSDFNGGHLVAKVIRLFRNSPSPEISVEKAIREIYSEELSIHSFDRLRKAISRLNSDLAQKLGVEKSFNLTKSHLVCFNHFTGHDCPPRSDLQSS